MLATAIRLQMTGAFHATVEAAARARGQTLTAFVNQVLRDFLLAAEARAGTPHPCCYCRDGNPAGLARCCLCDQWGVPFVPRPGVPIRILTRAS